ncbi:hypothetical protein OBV_34370 [Oscillibacter valericigenes Sjm18-20]|nr:hypothetical protein OBV_34370 [Oscillibacter valericigenes Sjm18-20]
MLEILKDTFEKSVAAVSVKSESIVESSRVRSAISNMQKSMDTDVNALGVKYYNSWLNGSVDTAELEVDCAKIQEIGTEVAALKARLEQIKAEESQILGSQKRSAGANVVSTPQSGFVFCTNCGKKLEAGARFCDECGTPVKI